MPSRLASLDELRALSRGFAPPILLDRGLIAALESAATRSAVPIDIVDVQWQEDLSNVTTVQRVLRIPTEQTVHQRFGIVVHQVLERYHADGSIEVGQGALKAQATDPRNAIVSVKRFMGRGLKDVAHVEAIMPYDFEDGPGMLRLRTVQGVKSWIVSARHFRVSQITSISTSLGKTSQAMFTMCSARTPPGAGFP